MATETEAYISVSGLTLKTPAGYVYRDVTFSAQQRQVVCLFGTEGSGRTSLMLTLGGRMKPTFGQDIVAGYDTHKQYKKVRDLSNITIVHRVNDVPENLRCSDILGSELSLVGKSGRKAAVAEYLEQWQFTDYAKTRYRDLESYERALFGIMLALCGDPQLLMVDDVQSGLTQHQGIKLVKLLKQLAAERGITILFNCSEYEIARFADGIVVLSQRAEEQRQAVIAEGGYSVPVFGRGNGVEVPEMAAAASAPTFAEPRTAPIDEQPMKGGLR